MNSVKLKQGQTVWYREVPHQIKSIHGDDMRLVLPGDPSAPIRKISIKDCLASGELKLKSDYEDPHSPSWDSLSDKQQETARKKYDSISSYFENVSAGMSRMAATKLAADLSGVSERTIRDRIKKFRDMGLAGLAPSGRIGGMGKSRLQGEVQEIIESFIEKFHLRRTGVSVSKLVRLIGEECEKRQLNAPARETVQLRIDEIPWTKVMSAREGKKAARSKGHVSRGAFPLPEAPLSVVQFDHTPLDMILVDRQFRLPIGRPYLTLAIDVITRIIYGFFLSLQPPSYISVAMCLLNGILPKNKLLERFDLPSEDWPLYGLPSCIHVDNGRDFRSKHLLDFCNEYQINLEFRPIRTPQYGGHIERVFRTINSGLHELPGTTFSSVHHKGDYKSEDQACITLDDLEKYIVASILEYHLTVHSGIKMPPLMAWEDAVRKGTVEPIVPLDTNKMIIDLLPYHIRTIQKDGVGLFDLHYTSPSLQLIRNAEKKRDILYKVKYDPRDISKVYLFNPTIGRYETLYLSDRRIGSIGLAELDQIKFILKHQKKKFNTSNLGLYWRYKQELIEQSKASQVDSKRIRRVTERMQRAAAHSASLFGEPINKSIQDSEQSDGSQFAFDPSSISLDGIKVKRDE